MGTFFSANNWEPLGSDHRPLFKEPRGQPCKTHLSFTVHLTPAFGATTHPLVEPQFVDSFQRERFKTPCGNTFSKWALHSKGLHSRNVKGARGPSSREATRAQKSSNSKGQGPNGPHFNGKMYTQDKTGTKGNKGQTRGTAPSAPSTP